MPSWSCPSTFLYILDGTIQYSSSRCQCLLNHQTASMGAVMSKQLCWTVNDQKQNHRYRCIQWLNLFSVSPVSPTPGSIRSDCQWPMSPAETRIFTNSSTWMIILIHHQDVADRTPSYDNGIYTATKCPDKSHEVVPRSSNRTQEKLVPHLSKCDHTTVPFNNCF